MVINLDSIPSGYIAAGIEIIQLKTNIWHTALLSDVKANQGVRFHKICPKADFLEPDS